MDPLGLSIGVVALVITFYAAISARRSASAAERSADAADRAARAAEEAMALEREEIRERWISQLADALPDGKRVTRLLADLPSSLSQDWRQLMTSAAGRNPRTPDGYFREMLGEHAAEWEEAAQSTSLPAETKSR